MFEILSRGPSPSSHNGGGRSISAVTYFDDPRFLKTLSTNRQVAAVKVERSSIPKPIFT